MYCRYVLECTQDFNVNAKRKMLNNYYLLLLRKMLHYYMHM